MAIYILQLKNSTRSSWLNTELGNQGRATEYLQKNGYALKLTGLKKEIDIITKENILPLSKSKLTFRFYSP
jgi:hypothetical protein